jgi:hypothetical protein
VFKASEGAWISSSDELIARKHFVKGETAVVPSIGRCSDHVYT